MRTRSHKTSSFCTPWLKWNTQKLLLRVQSRLKIWRIKELHITTGFQVRRYWLQISCSLCLYLAHISQLPRNALQIWHFFVMCIEMTLKGKVVFSTTALRYSLCLQKDYIAEKSAAATHSIAGPVSQLLVFDVFSKIKLLITFCLFHPTELRKMLRTSMCLKYDTILKSVTHKPYLK